MFKNGGGTFLVPYFIMLFLVGLPMYFMELAIAQYSGLGPTRIFGRMAPIFKGKIPKINKLHMLKYE